MRVGDTYRPKSATGNLIYTVVSIVEDNVLMRPSFQHPQWPEIVAFKINEVLEEMEGL